MTLTQLRQAVMTVVQQIVTDHTAYPLVVETPNRDVVDQAAQVNPYLAIAVKPLTGEQAEIGIAPLSRMDGQIQISAVVKDGAGVADAEALLDFVLPYFHLQNLATVQCQAAHAVGGREVKGWWYESAIVPYYYFTK
jgi:hypothetical protein